MSTTIPEIFSSLWIAVHGNIYEVTTFILDHPGGIEALQTDAGTDGTGAYEYAGYSTLNTKTLQQFQVGTLEGARSAASISSGLPLPYATKRRAQITTLALTISKILLAMAVIRLVAFTFRQGIASHELEVEEIGEGGGEWSAGYAFWIGVMVMFSLGIFGGAWFWSLFREALEYDTGFPATIPRRRMN